MRSFLSRLECIPTSVSHLGQSQRRPRRQAGTHLGAAVVYYRKRAGLTIAETARRTELTRAAPHGLGRVKTELEWGTARRIAAAFGVSLAQIADTSSGLEQSKAISD